MPITSPTEGSSFAPGAVITVSGTDGPVVRFEIQVPGQPVTVINILNPQNGNWQHTITLPNVNNVDIVITAVGQTGVIGSRGVHLN